MELKLGYKQTEVGIIPKDWEVKALFEILKFGSGKDYKHLSSGEIPVYGTGGLMTFVDHFLYQGDSVGIGRKGTIDKPVFLSGKFWTVDTLFYTHTFSGVLPKFIYYKFLLVKWKEFNEASGVPSLNKNTLDKIKISVPNISEQIAIANALSAMDALIAQTEKLIEKKKAIKQGAMQELFKPKEGWLPKKLGDVCEIKKGQLITDSIRVNGNIPVIAGGKSPAYYHNKANRLGKTITISGSGASAGYVALHTQPIFASDCSTISESKYYKLEFIFYWLQLNQFKIYKMQTGGAQPHIHPSDLNPLEFNLPPIEKQNEIADTLYCADLEIRLLELKFTKLRHQKQGMMQALLTGKIRLV
jgi:type I restriction enzyme S subunit